MNTHAQSRKNTSILLFVSAAVVLLHWYNNAWTTYGIFRDELYYIACSEHLAFGYVDQPPLCALILRFHRALFGDSLFALRLIPSIAHAVTALLAGLMTRTLGGGTFAQTLTALSIALAPGLMGMFGIYSMNAIEILLWTSIFFVLMQLLETGKSRYWIVIGLLTGIGLMNKISMGWLAAGIAAGFVFTEQRRWLKTSAPWIAAGLALVIFSPYILWNIQNDFAHIEFAANASRLKYSSQTPITFLSGMVLLYNPLAFPILVSGFWILMRHERRTFRVIGIAIITVLVILLVNIHSKTEYFNPAAVMLLAAGSVQIEWWFSRGRFVSLKTVYGASLVITGMAVTPMAIDILPVETFITYSRSLGVTPPSTEGHQMGDLPQHYADRFGWKELAGTVARVYDDLPEGEKKNVLIYAQNYGEAGAIDFYGKDKGLPRTISGHNNYWLWSKQIINDSLSVGIIVGGEAEDHRDTFEEVTLAGVHKAPFAMDYEKELKIFVCRKPKFSIKEIWHTARRYI